MLLRADLFCFGRRVLAEIHPKFLGRRGFAEEKKVEVRNPRARLWGRAVQIVILFCFVRPGDIFFSGWNSFFFFASSCVGRSVCA